MSDNSTPSFTVLNADENSDAETDIGDEDWTPDFKKNQERKRLINIILKLSGEDDGSRIPHNVVIIGRTPFNVFIIQCSCHR